MVPRVFQWEHVPICDLRPSPAPAASMALEQQVGAGRGVEGDAACSVGSEISKKAPDAVTRDHVGFGK